MPGAHSPRSPSSAHRWRLCKAAIRMEEGLPDTAGEEAKQGTVFHEFAADVLETGVSPMSVVRGGASYLSDEDGQYRPYTAEMAIKMQPGLDLVWSLADEPGARLFVETRLDLSPWLGPDEFGTSDVCIVDVPNRRMYVFDWKWGAGVPVSPDRNDQAILYGLGCWNSIAGDLFYEHEVEQADKLGQDFNPNVPWEDDIEVIIIIEQPRAPGGGGVWETTLGWLLSEGRKIKKDADETRNPAAECNPGAKQCSFCKAAFFNTCEARADWLAEMLFEDPDSLEDDFMFGVPSPLKDRQALSPEQKSQLMLNKAVIEKFLQSIHDEMVEEAKQSGDTPGMKLVSGRRPPRSWADAKKAELLVSANLKSKAYRKKVLSPTQVEEEVGTEEYERLYEAHVARGDAKPILVPDSDPRVAIASTNELLDELW